MRLGDERLQLRINIAEISTVKFWTELKLPDGAVWQRYCLSRAGVCYPRIGRIVYRKRDAGRVRTKTEAKGIISEYLKKAKFTAKLIYQFAHGKNGTESAVPKRDSMFEEGDILAIFLIFQD